MVIVLCSIARCIIFGVPRLPVRPCDERPPAMYGHFGLVPRVSVHDRYYCNTNSVCVCVCVCVCLSSIGGQTAGPIMTKFGTNMRIDLGMVPTKYWPHEWPGSVGSLGPISESGLSCQLLLRAVVWQMTSQLIRRRNDVVFAAFNQPVSMRPMNVQKINNNFFYPPHPGGSSVPGWGLGGQNFKSAGNFTNCRENR